MARDAGRNGDFAGHRLPNIIQTLPAWLGELQDSEESRTAMDHQTQATYVAKSDGNGRGRILFCIYISI